MLYRCINNLNLDFLWTKGNLYDITKNEHKKYNHMVKNNLGKKCYFPKHMILEMFEPLETIYEDDYFQYVKHILFANKSNEFCATWMKDHPYICELFWQRFVAKNNLS